ncbi:long-chain-alcohol oxidase FAO4A-like [Iris pallida]|uniref:Long-chain-alcohol oxidase n=1 Tax=Iris pallida TaxID=29817 RepID=A0AAX6F9W9_IRIPA|nr:long-chain-alcohol oxidase FAO4A-like [Iris pallida]
MFEFEFQVDEKGENPTWKALGYCGPDPEHIKKKQQQQQQQGSDADRLGPLHSSLVYMHNSKDALSSALSRAGISLATRPPPPPLQKPLLSIQCDAVVVGSGSGGGVVAGVLAQAGYKVVVLEKGDYRARANLTLLEGQTIRSMYEGGGLLATDDTGVVILAGSTVGGGSSVNWSASLRTPDHVVSEWRDEHGLELFGSDAYEAASDAVCARMGVQAEVGGDESLSNSVLRRGCSELGYPVENIPRNSAPDHRCGWCCFGCRDGRKKGTCETWLADMAESGNGVVLPGCRAVRVLHEDRGRRRSVATGVAFEYDGGWSEKGTCVVEARVTVVACGALNTPVLLRRSGLRNANIGRNLHLHPVAMAWGHFPGSGKKSYEGGIMTAMSPVPSSSNPREKYKYGAIIQTPSLHPGMFSVVTPWTSGADYKGRMARFAETAHVFTLARDRGSGTVDPRGHISYRMEGSDEENLRRGTERTLRILAAAGAAEVGTHHRSGDRLDVKAASSHEFERFVREAGGREMGNGLSTLVCSAHQMGSCRMGVDPKTSAVDPNGETWEVEGLYVADASVFPTALGVNPMVTVQAIAYCTAQSVLEVLRRKIKRRRRRRRSSV